MLVEGDLSDLDLLTLSLSHYKYTYYTSTAKAPNVTTYHLPQHSPSTLSTVESLAKSVYLCRSLINTPAEDCTPSTLQSAVSSLPGGTTRAWVGSDLLTPCSSFDAVRAGGVCGLIHAVGRAATEPDRLPRLVVYESEDADPAWPTVSLVGKGVTFDTGGLSMKSPAGMLKMKKDMGGAAHVIALAQLIISESVPVNLRVYVAAVENCVDSLSIRPLDVVTSLSGLSAEIANTDAEGRLVLADALSLACVGSDAVIDFATLTGAARVALGTDVACYFSNDDGIAGDVEEGAGRVMDPSWRMPLHAGYAGRLKSGIADVRNIPSDGGQGGAITAALFLQRFVEEGVKWVHWDVNGASGDGGEAQGLRATFEAVKALAKRGKGD